MSKLVDLVVNTIKQSQNAYCKYISSNGAGKTGANQMDTIYLKMSPPHGLIKTGEKG
ncbi:hypothetical protein GCM10007084_33250 [Parabacteroides faecis]|nr:hypothetical protein GCM10007084_33250 [Parabacteroides faecis]